ncbi:MAG: glycosyltransferase family 2 protein [Lachnospiraceae bacterium]|nr:glycosyltransferase family 2 protein [Lachnospiraceae bacterium]
MKSDEIQKGKEDGVSKTAVVIPNYNGIKFLSDCLNSLKKQSVQDFEVVVVDDCSSDDSIKEIECNFSWVKCVKRIENGGFAVAVNDGIRYAKENGAEYIVLLNNDTVAEEHFIEKLVAAVEGDKNCFSAQAKMLSLKEPEIIDDAGDFYTVLGWAYARGKGKNNSKYNKKGRIFASCGGAAIYRAEVFDKIGYFDETHFAYLEDIDIGYRAGLFGYYNLYEPEAVVYHAGSATSGSRYNEFKIRLAARNSVILIYKNQTVLQVILHFVPLTAGFLIKQLFFAIKGYGKTYHKAVLEGLKLCSIPEMKQKKIGIVKGHFADACKLEWQLWVNVLRKILQ